MRMRNTNPNRISARLALYGLLSIVSVAGLSACAPTISHHGYMAVDAAPSKDIKAGDDIAVVQDKLGSPSQTSTFQPNIWYYIDQTNQKMTYKPNVVIQRQVTVIVFDKDMKKVASVKTLALADGIDISPNPNETPTRGRSLTALEQILGTVGRQRIAREEDQNPGSQHKN